MSRSIDPVHMTLDRIALEHPAPARFRGYEVEEWPEHAIEAMVRAGLLAETTRTNSAICTGCEAQCHKPVIVRLKPGANAPSAFIACDEVADHSRIPVRLSRLNQFQGSLAMTGRCVATALKLDTREPENVARHSVLLGSHRGRNGHREVVLGVKNARLRLSVGKHEQDLVDFVTWANGNLSVNHALLQRLANRKGRQNKDGSTKSQIEKSARTDRTELLAERDEEILRRARRLKTGSKTLTKVSEEIAAMPFLRSPRGGLRPISPATVRRIVTKAWCH